MTQEAPQSPFHTAKTQLQTSSLAIVSLVSGIASWFVLPLLGALVAIITGHLARKEIRESDGSISGIEMANAGLLLGYLHLAVAFVGICVLIVLIAGLIAVLGAAGWSSSYIRIIR